MDTLRRSLGVLTIIMLAIGLWFVWQAPADFQQGKSVRILFLHVPSAKMALFSYLVVTLAAAYYLWKKSEVADIIVEAAVAVGAGFALVTLATGSIWGKPMWGAWWAWDARLTSVLVLLIIYVGLMGVRNGIDNPLKAAKASAILAIVGAVDLPIIHFSVVWWRTLHQPPSLAGGPGKIAIEGPLLMPLIVMSIAFFVMATYMMVLKYQSVQARRALVALQDERFHHG